MTCPEYKKCMCFQCDNTSCRFWTDKIPDYFEELGIVLKGLGDKMKGMELLRKKIDQAGFKLTYVAERLNLTYQGFKKKLDGDTEFKASEIAVLKDLLKLSDADVQAIFFDDDVDGQSTRKAVTT